MREVHSSPPVRPLGDGVVACVRAASDVRPEGPYLSSHFFAAFLAALKDQGWELWPKVEPPSIPRRPWPREVLARPRDFTQDGAITMRDLVEAGATEALVSLQQACDLYTEMQQTVRFEDCADMEGVAFRPRKPAWRGILIRPVVA